MLTSLNPGKENCETCQKYESVIKSERLGRRGRIEENLAQINQDK